MSSSNDRETKELIEQLRAKRLRRKWTRMLGIGLATAIALAVIVIAAVFVTRAPSSEASGFTSLLAGGASPASNPNATRAAVTTPGDTFAKEPVTTVVATPATTAGTGPNTTAGPHTTSASPPGPSANTTTSAPPTTATTNLLADKVIVIDPGHQARADPTLEPIGPGSARKKAKVSSGTSSVLTGVRESEVALAVGLKLRDALARLGIKVVMTRTSENVEVSNRERAQIANRARADLNVRLHANGSGDRSVHGLFTLYPATIKGWTDDIASASKRAADIVQRELIAATGAKDRGLQERSDLTGFNWSDVPVILVEMGFMSNPTEDKRLRDPGYQDKLVQGLVTAIIEYLRTE